MEKICRRCSATETFIDTETLRWYSMESEPVDIFGILMALRKLHMQDVHRLFGICPRMK